MRTNSSVSSGWVQCDAELPGKTVIITGANTGIGLETAKDLVKRKARVILACRNVKKAEAAKAEIVKETGCDESQLVVKTVDLSSLESVKEFSKDINANEKTIDILINNAGVMMCPKSTTKDGFEMQFGTNHLGHFLLTNLLLDRIKASQPSRIVNVSSRAHESSARLDWDDLNSDGAYSPYGAYCKSKLANVLFTRELSKRLEGTAVTANSLHPGVVQTELWRHLFDPSSFWRRTARFLAAPFLFFGFKSPQHGAQTSIFCAVAPELNGISGKYFSDCAEKEASPFARDEEAAIKLWEISEDLCGMKKMDSSSGC